ncbi:hypothetical protein ACJJTC_005267 [Scirpophaga incertulas]
MKSLVIGEATGPARRARVPRVPRVPRGPRAPVCATRTRTALATGLACATCAACDACTTCAACATGATLRYICRVCHMSRVCHMCRVQPRVAGPAHLRATAPSRPNLMKRAGIAYGSLFLFLGNGTKVSCRSRREISF